MTMKHRPKSISPAWKEGKGGKWQQDFELGEEMETLQQESAEQAKRACFDEVEKAY
jgi:hypothetical protein